jgi:hypothetical protein
MQLQLQLQLSKLSVTLLERQTQPEKQVVCADRAFPVRHVVLVYRQCAYIHTLCGVPVITQLSL